MTSSSRIEGASERKYIFCWNRPSLPGRKGARCSVLVRGGKNSCLVRFDSDGFKAVVSRNALQRAAAEKQPEGE